MIETLRMISFAGQPVPDDGLTIQTPQGWDLTVWPDGRYAFAQPEGGAAGGQAPVTTYYSYVMEDIDGSTSVGTLALNPGDEAPGPMEDFQAWSLPELLHDEADAARLLLGGEDGHDHAAAAADALVHEPHLDFMGDGSFDDDLTRLILHSQNS
ncbi:hypothetical protein [Desulfomicrobium escambiense]|uniref:hypothetical protein n=1 Tax=Desulfomicrobium escambiense TaxID=29503 RepID=UPI0003FB0C80|nr:hypothetical protein [Desulfomicrobium escambiense]